MFSLLLATAAAAGVATALTVPVSGVSEAEFANGVLTAPDLNKRAPDSVHLENWSGATKAATGINKIAGTVNVPHWRNRADNWYSGMYMAVRIDGLPPCNKDSPLVDIWHATGQLSPEADTQFRASWAWGDDAGGSENVISFPLRPGDRVHMELIVLSPTSINGTIKNLNTGQETYRIMGNDRGFCGQTANWIVGSYLSLEKPMPFTDFLDPVTWTDASATTASGKTLNLDGARAMDLDAPWLTNPVRGGLQTDCNIINASSVTCKRLWPSPPNQ